MKFQHQILLLPVILFFISCGTPKKVPFYIEQLRDTTITNTAKFPEPKIQKNDLLSIFVYSEALKKEEIDRLFNLPSTSEKTAGFLVDGSGDIDYPGIGKIHAEEMTKNELAGYIINKLGEKGSGELKNPKVIIRWLNYKVTFLGEVAREGMVNLPGEKVNILEAISLAGGITPYGKKETVRVVRENDDNTREIGTVDLTSMNVFSSPYYYVKQNDIILVDPSKAKVRPEDVVTWQKITAVLGLITSLVFIYEAIFNN